MMPIPMLRARMPRLATTILAIALSLVAYGSLKSGPTHNPPGTETVTTTAAAQTSSTTKIEVEVVTLQPHGFEPAEITRPQGRFMLGVDNRSGLEDIQLQVERVDRSRVPVLKNRNRRLSWREEVDLPPGQYVIGEVNHPEWTCLITITSR